MTHKQALAYEAHLKTISDRELTALWVRYCRPSETLTPEAEKAAIGGRADAVNYEMSDRRLI